MSSAARFPRATVAIAAVLSTVLATAASAECNCTVSAAAVPPTTLAITATTGGECGNAGVTLYQNEQYMTQVTCWGQSSCVVDREYGTACLETGSHDVSAACTCGRMEGTACVTDTGSACGTFSVDTTPKLHGVTYSGPDVQGAGQLIVDYEFPNTHTQPSRDLRVYVDGNYATGSSPITIQGQAVWSLGTTCWSEGEHVIEVRAQACDNPGASFNTQRDTRVTVNTKPEVSVSVGGPDNTGRVNLNIDYNFENTSTSTQRDVFVHRDGLYQFAFSPGAVSGTYSQLISTDCLPQGGHSYEVKARACDNEAAPYVSWAEDQFAVDHKPTVNLEMSPVDPLQPAGTQKVRLAFSFPQTRLTNQRYLALERADGSAIGHWNTGQSGVYEFNLSCSASGSLLHAVAVACSDAGSHDAASLPSCEPECERCPDCVGDPVRTTSGNVRMTDAEALPGATSFVASRTYDSRSGAVGRFGLGWMSIFDSRLTVTRYGARFLRTPSNDRVLFALGSGGYTQIWPSSGATRDRLSWDAASQTYRYRAAGARSELIYRSPDGRLVAIEEIATGDRVTITYDAAGFPVRVADQAGNWAWVIQPDASGRIGAIDVEGRPDIRWTYQYSSSRLASVTASGGAPWRSYTYDAGQRLQVATGPIGELFESHLYDAQGNAISSSGPRGEITGIAYLASGRVAGEMVTRVQYATGAVNDHYSRSIAGKYRLVEVAGACPACGLYDTVYGHDSWGHVVREQDGRGYVTVSDYEPSGERLVRTHGPYRPAGCDPETASDHCRLAPETILTAELVALPTTTSTEYVYGDASWPDRITETRRPSVLETGAMASVRSVYEPVTGNLLRSEHRGWTGDGIELPRREEVRVTEHAYYDGTATAAFDPGGAFESAWLALPQPRGHLRSTNGPRQDVTDVTLHVYYPIDQLVPATWRGRRAASRNAAGHVQRWEEYDVFGNPGRVVDANGVATTFAYDALGRTVGTTLEGVPGCDAGADPLCETDLTTARTFAPSSSPLATVTTPGGGVSVLAYDGRGRISSQSRGPSASDLRERIEYDYDPETGGRSQQRILGADGAGWTERSRESYEYDLDGRLHRLVHPDGAFVEYGYDVLGNLVAVQDENHSSPNTFHAHDASGRLTETRQTLSTAPGGEIVTSYGYDAQGSLSEVVDANGNSTTYLTDDFGQLIVETSPVTGVTVADFDPAGNQVYRRDARGVEAFHRYDALGRILQTSFGSATAEPDLVWEYDSAQV